MDRYSRKEDGRPQLLDLIPKERREWLVERDQAANHGPSSSEEKKLELRLGPPGGDWTMKHGDYPSRQRDHDSSLLSFGSSSFSNSVAVTHNASGSKRNFQDTVPWSQQQQAKAASFLQLQSTTQQGSNITAVANKESSQPCCNKVLVDLQQQQQQQIAEKKAFSTPSAAANTAVANNSAQKRTAPAPVVGWPPIRSFRKNITSSSSSKLTTESQNAVLNKVASEKPPESSQKGLFVKINMDGVPIGRKVDLKAHDSYDKLSSTVDKLFRGLLAAQNDSSAGEIKNKDGGEKTITGLLDGTGEYTLVYEDNEGDRMLVGDVPWHMFVTTVKRLRVLKTSELPTLCRGSKQGKLSLNASLR